MADLEQLFGSDSEDDDFQPHKVWHNGLRDTTLSLEVGDIRLALFIC